MKKNILTVIIMACTCINLILTIVVVFAVVPAMSKTNTLVTKVASIIDLEIDSQSKDEEEYSVSDLETYTCAYESKQTINLKPDANEDKSHYAILESVIVYFNPEAEDYSDIKASVEKSSVYIQDLAKEVIGESTFTTLNEKNASDETLKRIQQAYKTKAIVRVSFGGFLFS